MATKTAVGGSDDFWKVIHVIAALGTAATFLKWARRFL
jgi:hypothetical protein